MELYEGVFIKFKKVAELTWKTDDILNLADATTLHKKVREEYPGNDYHFEYCDTIDSKTIRLKKRPNRWFVRIKFRNEGEEAAFVLRESAVNSQSKEKTMVII